MHRQVNPLFFWLGVVAVAGLPLIVQLGVPVVACLALAGVAVLPLLIRGLLAGVQSWTQGRPRRARKGKGAPVCQKCGYDLRASPDRCPECGAPVDPMDAALVRYFMSLQSAEGGPPRFRVRRRTHGAPGRG